MNKVQRMLMIVFWSNVVVVAIVILTGETNFMPYDRFKGDTKTEFYLLTIMELAATRDSSRVNVDIVYPHKTLFRKSFVRCSFGSPKIC